MSASQPNVWIMVPCKGRLAYLKKSLPTFSRQGAAGVCVVDYDCPEGCGDWVKEAPKGGGSRPIVEKVAGRPLFNKSAAHNLAAQRIIRENGEYLVFLDADTLIAGELVQWLTPRLRPDTFFIAGLDGTGKEAPGLVGLLVVHRDMFQRCGGYDEKFVGWGGEDIDLRLRLHVDMDLDFEEIPVSLFKTLEHSDELRTAHYSEKDPDRSNMLNYVRLVQGLRKRTGLTLNDLPPRADRLFRYIPTRVAPGPPPLARTDNPLPEIALP